MSRIEAKRYNCTAYKCWVKCSYNYFNARITCLNVPLLHIYCAQDSAAIYMNTITITIWCEKFQCLIENDLRSNRVSKYLDFPLATLWRDSKQTKTSMGTDSNKNMVYVSDRSSCERYHLISVICCLPDTFFICHATNFATLIRFYIVRLSKFIFF